MFKLFKQSSGEDSVVLKIKTPCITNETFL